MLTGKAWTRSRQTLTPTFSTLKMKMVGRDGGREGGRESGREGASAIHQFFPVQMLPLIKKSCDTLVEKLGECIDSDKSVEVFRLGLGRQ